MFIGSLWCWNAESEPYRVLAPDGSDCLVTPWFLPRSILTPLGLLALLLMIAAAFLLLVSRKTVLLANGRRTLVATALGMLVFVSAGGESPDSYDQPQQTGLRMPWTVTKRVAGRQRTELANQQSGPTWRTGQRLLSRRVLGSWVHALLTSGRKRSPAFGENTNASGRSPRRSSHG